MSPLSSHPGDNRSLLNGISIGLKVANDIGCDGNAKVRCCGLEFSADGVPSAHLIQDESALGPAGIDPLSEAKDGRALLDTAEVQNGGGDRQERQVGQDEQGSAY